MLANSELAHVLKVLAELPESDRTALLLRAEHELPCSQIAAVLGSSVAAAKVRVHRPLAQIAISSLRS